MAQNKDLVADAQTLLEENLSEKKSVESARRLVFVWTGENVPWVPEPQSFYYSLALVPRVVKTELFENADVTESIYYVSEHAHGSLGITRGHLLVCFLLSKHL